MNRITRSAAMRLCKRAHFWHRFPDDPAAGVLDRHITDTALPRRRWLRVRSRFRLSPQEHLMPLTRFLQDTSLGPEEISVLVAVYEAALRELDLTGHTDPGAETLARGAFSVRGL